MNNSADWFYKNAKTMFIICIIFMLFSSIVTAFAVSSYLYNSNEVSYNNASSNSISSSNVQGAIDELYADAHNYSEMNTRVTALENRWKNGTTSYFDGDYLRLTAPSTSASNSRGLLIYDNNDKTRGRLIYDPGTDTTYLDAVQNTGTGISGILNLRANPVKINNYVASATIDARASTADLNTAYTSQPNLSVWTITGQNEANVPSGVPGNIHFVLSYKVDNNWGSQWLFKYGEIWQRSRSTNGWSSWAKKL